MFETGSHWAPRGRQDRAERTTRQRAKVSVLCLSGPPARTQRPERPSANQVSKYFKVFMTPIPVNNHIEIHAWHRLLMHLGLETLLLLESRPLRKNTRPVTLQGFAKQLRTILANAKSQMARKGIPPFHHVQKTQSQRLKCPTHAGPNS